MVLKASENRPYHAGLVSVFAVVRGLECKEGGCDETSSSLVPFVSSLIGTITTADTPWLLALGPPTARTSGSVDVSLAPAPPMGQSRKWPVPASSAG